MSCSPYFPQTDCALLGHSQYILWAMSPPRKWKCPRRGKKLTFELSPTCWEDSKVFPKLVAILSENNLNLKNVPRQEQKSFYLIFFSFDEAQKPLLGFVAHRIYWGWPYQLITWLEVWCYRNSHATKHLVRLSTKHDYPDIAILLTARLQIEKVTKLESTRGLS